MGKSKAKREARKLQKAAEEKAKREAEAAQERAAAARRKVLAAIPIFTAALAAALWFATENTKGVAIVLLVGGLAFLGYGLTVLGGSVEPRDRGRAGAIDFGASQNEERTRKKPKRRR